MKDFMRPDGSRALIVDAYDGDGYIQIYMIGGKQSWVGNYYEKTGLGEFKMVGQVHLEQVH